MKRHYVLFSILLILVLAFDRVPSLIYAQKEVAPNQSEIPSDLSLDLTLAKQNPAPERKEIISSGTNQVVITTNTGEKTTIVPQDTVVARAETEPATDSINPQLSTSEQVITEPVTVEVDQNGTPIPTAGDNSVTSSPVNPDEITPTGTNSDVVPGTNVEQPDDNAAPSDNSSDPNLPAPTPSDANSPTSAVSPVQAQDTPTDIPQDTPTDIPQDTPTDIPQDTPTDIPQDTPTDIPQDTPTPGNSTPQDTPTDIPQDTPTPDNSVQGVQTGPSQNLIGTLVQMVWYFFTGK